MIAGLEFRARRLTALWGAALFLIAGALALAAPAGEDPLAFPNGLYNRKMYALAIPEYEKFLQNNPNHAAAAQAALLLGNCYTRTNEWAKAAGAYRRSLEKAPTGKTADDARLGLGQAYFELEQYDKASAIYSEMLTKTKDRKLLAQAQYWVGESEFNQKRYEQAEAAYKAVTEKYPESDLVPYAFYSMGVSAGERGDPQAAAQALRVVRDRYPKFDAIEEVQVRLGDALRALKKFPEAREAYAPVVAANPPGELRPAALLGTAYCALDQKDYAAAFTTADEAVRSSKEGTRERREAEMVKSHALYGLKKYGDALKGYETLKESKDADLAEMAFYWSGVSHLANKEYDPAIGDFQQLLQRFPKSSLAPKAQLRIGDCQAGAGRAKEAAEAYTMVLQKYAGTDAAKDASTGLKELVGGGATAMDTTQLRELIQKLPAGALADDANLQLANKEFTDKHYKEAIAAAEKVMAGKPAADAGEQALYLIGASKLQSQDPEGAAASYQKLVADYPQGKLAAQALLELSWAYTDLKKPAEAVKACRDLLARNPDGDQKISALMTLAEACVADGKYKDAEDACEKVIALNPKAEDMAAALYTYAWAPHKEKRFDDAAPRWQKAIEKLKTLDNSPLLPRALYFAGYDLTQLKRYPEADAFLEQAAAAKGDLAEQALYELGWNQVEEKATDKAVATFEKLAADYPEGKHGAEALFVAGEQFFLKKDYAGAAQRYERALALKTEPELAYKINMQLGAALYYQPKYPEAAAAFARAAELVKTGKDGAEAVYWAGDAYGKADNWPQAGTFLARYLEMAPDGERVPDACLGAARSALAAGDAVKAATLIEKGQAGAQGETAAELQYRLGDALMKQQKPADAATAYLKVMVLFADSKWAADAQYQAGQAYEASGDKAKAIEVYKALVDKSPDTPAAAKARERLKALDK